VNGMSSWGHRRDSTPFCPWRVENLSPGTGLRLYLRRGHGGCAWA
jgi:hypothetical protein